jgi:hypothetical protein
MKDISIEKMCKNITSWSKAIFNGKAGLFQKKG